MKLARAVRNVGLTSGPGLSLASCGQWALRPASCRRIDEMVRFAMSYLDQVLAHSHIR
jgi:hypothetical protein